MKGAEANDIADIKDWGEDICKLIQGSSKIGNNNVGQLAMKNCSELLSISDNKKLFAKNVKALESSLKEVIYDNGIPYFKGDISRCHHIMSYTQASLNQMLDQAELIKSKTKLDFFKKESDGMLCKLIKAYNNTPKALEFYNKKKDEHGCDKKDKMILKGDINTSRC